MSSSPGRARARRGRPVTPGLLAALSLVAAPAWAQAAGTPGPVERTYHVAVRVGVAVSSPLVEDSVAPGASVVTASPDVGPTAGVSAWVSLRERMDLEVELGWSGVDLGGDDGLAEWTVDELGIVHGAVLLRVRATSGLYGRGGLGFIRYTGDRAGGFLRDDAQIHPYVTAGLGAHTSVGRFLLFAEANAQAHRFSFLALREAGGRRGVVWRGLVQAGAALPLGGAP